MEHEAIIRLSIFLGVFGALSLVEVLNPRRARVVSRKKRWVTNWGIILVDTLALRLLALALPLLAVGAAVDAHSLGLGLFNILNLPVAVEFILAILVWILPIWLQHLLTHKIPLPVAITPRASRRSRHGRDNRDPISSRRNSIVHAFKGWTGLPFGAIRTYGNRV